MFMVGTFGAVEEDCWHFPAKPDYFWNLAENQGGASEWQRRHTESLLSVQSSVGPVLGGQNKLQLNKTIALTLSHMDENFWRLRLGQNFFHAVYARTHLVAIHRLLWAYLYVHTVCNNMFKWKWFKFYVKQWITWAYFPL